VSGQGAYARAASSYRQLGWGNPIPVKDKWPPPTGYTGRGGADVSDGDLGRWTRGPEGRYNIALRLPGDVIGVDVDHYGGKRGGDTLASAEAELGPLPAAWRVTSRGAGQPSGILLFRVPEGLDWSGAEGNLRRFGDHIDVLHRGHRYAMVAPSLHPKTRQPYRWYDPGGKASGRAPRPEELAELPATWVELLTAAPVEPTPAAVAEGDHPVLLSEEAESRPGNDLNGRGSWAEILEPLGWKRVGRAGGLDYWRRPGEHEGHQATTGVRGNGGDLMVNFSTTVPLPTSRGLSRFTVYGELHHGGDFAAAARALSTRGYGAPPAARRTGGRVDPPRPRRVPAPGAALDEASWEAARSTDAQAAPGHHEPGRWLPAWALQQGPPEPATQAGPR
jgi:hypothetical protein